MVLLTGGPGAARERAGSTSGARRGLGGDAHEDARELALDEGELYGIGGSAALDAVGPEVVLDLVGRALALVAGVANEVLDAVRLAQLRLDLGGRRPQRDL